MSQPLDCDEHMAVTDMRAQHAGPDDGPSISGRFVQPPRGSQITPRMRSTLCGWLIEVAQEFRLHQDTLHLCISLLDRFLHLQPGVTKHQLQIVGTACMFISAKQEEVTFPGLTAFADTANNSFSRQELAQTEVVILETLQWRVAMPTSTKNILDHLIRDFDLDSKAAHFATYLTELWVVDNCTTRNAAPRAALAAVFVAGGVSGSTATRKKIKEKCMLRECPPALRQMVQHLLRLYEQAYWEQDPVHHNYVLKEKFDAEVWESVSVIFSPNELPITIRKAFPGLNLDGMEVNDMYQEQINPNSESAAIAATISQKAHLMADASGLFATDEEICTEL